MNAPQMIELAKYLIEIEIRNSDRESSRFYQKLIEMLIERASKVAV